MIDGAIAQVVSVSGGSADVRLPDDDADTTISIKLDSYDPVAVGDQVLLLRVGKSWACAGKLVSF